MKFLVDAQLPPKLCSWLSQKNEKARHAGNIKNGLTLTDERIWKIALKHKEIIVTKDRDFPEKALVSKRAPQIIHISLGNSSTSILINELEKSWSEIESAIKSNAKIVVVGSSYIKILE